MSPARADARIVALGGAGDMGRVAVRHVARMANVGRLTIADRDFERAAALAAEIGGGATEIVAARVDAADDAALRALLADADVVLNTTGPFYRFGPAVLDAAIATRTHYFDICDDWEPTIAMLGRDATAVAAGVTAVVGIGASPGASNLLAVLAARPLDEIHDLYTAWPVDVGDGAAAGEIGAGDGVPSAAVVHWMHQIAGRIRVASGGRLVDTAPLAPVELAFPGVGRGTAYTVGHPEPITLHANLGVRGASANVMVLSPGLLAYLRDIAGDIDAGNLSPEDAARLIGAPDAERGLRAERAAASIAGPGQLPPFFALAIGTRGGAVVRSGAMVLSFPPGMAAATGIPLAIGLEEWLAGRIPDAGVMAPGSALDPERFFAALAPHCRPALPPGDAMVAVASEVLGPGER